VQGSNLRPPACKAGALPTELTAQGQHVSQGTKRAPVGASFGTVLWSCSGASPGQPRPSSALSLRRPQDDEGSPARVPLPRCSEDVPIATTSDGHRRWLSSRSWSGRWCCCCCTTMFASWWSSSSRPCHSRCRSGLWTSLTNRTSSCCRPNLATLAQGALLYLPLLLGLNRAVAIPSRNRNKPTAEASRAVAPFGGRQRYSKRTDVLTRRSADSSCRRVHKPGARTTQTAANKEAVGASGTFKVSNGQATGSLKATASPGLTCSPPMTIAWNDVAVTDTTFNRLDVDSGDIHSVEGWAPNK
jgi:hypothetical protein